MEFLKAVVRDVIIYTIPFVTARTTLYPIVNINSRMQRNYRKIEEEANFKEKYQKYQNFAISEKIECAKETVSLSGYRGVYEKFENYIVPFIFARISEGFIYFPFMRFCLDIMNLEDPFYLLTGLAFFFVSLIGSFFLKFMGDVMRERRNFKSALALLSPSNISFWKQYEIELGCYHAYSLVQGYIQLITFWYLKPGIYMEVILFAFSRIAASISCQPLAILVQWGSQNEFDHSRLFERIIKRDGYSGLFAGARDLILNEIVFSSVLIPGCHIVASLI